MVGKINKRGGAKVRGSIGRPRVTELRTKYSVRFTVLELAVVQSRAAEACLPAAVYIRRAALGRPLIASVPRVNLAVYAELARSAANLNQLAHHLNSGRVFDDTVVSALGVVIDRMSEHVADLRALLITPTIEHDEEADD